MTRKRKNKPQTTAIGVVEAGQDVKKWATADLLLAFAGGLTIVWVLLIFAGPNISFLVSIFVLAYALANFIGRYARRWMDRRRKAG